MTNLGNNPPETDTTDSTEKVKPKGIILRNEELTRIIQVINLMSVVQVDSLGVVVGYRMPGRTGLALRKILRELKPIMEDAEAERQKLLALHGKRDKKGGLLVKDGKYVFEPKDQILFETAHREVLAAETEVFSTVSESGFIGVEIEFGLLLDLGPLLIEE